MPSLPCFTGSFYGKKKKMLQRTSTILIQGIVIAGISFKSINYQKSLFKKNTHKLLLALPLVNSELPEYLFSKSRDRR